MINLNQHNFAVGSGRGSYRNWFRTTVSGYPETNYIRKESLYSADATAFEQVANVQHVDISFESSKTIANCQLQMTVRHGIRYTFVTSQTPNDALNFLADDLKTKDLTSMRMVAVCMHATEAKDLHQQMAKRGVAGILYVDAHNEMYKTVLKMWLGSHLNQLLIMCDDMVPLMECSNVNYLINFTMASAQAYQQRFALTKTYGGEVSTLVMRMEHDAYCFYEPQVDVTLQVAAQVGEAKSKEWDATTESEDSSVNSKEQHVEAAKSKELDAPTESEDSSVNSEEQHIISALKPSVMDALSNNDVEYEKQGSSFRYAKYGVFAHSLLPQRACYDITSVPLASQLKQAMECLDIGRAFRTQRYAWPHTAAGHSLIVIAPEHKGKTWSYLPALCQRTHDIVLQRDVIASNLDYGPCSLIVCANLKNAEQIAYWCGTLLDFCRSDTELLVPLFDRSNVWEICSRLQQPCGILLTTVDLFGQLWKQHVKQPIFNEATLRCVAIDNLDKMWINGRLSCMSMMRQLLQLVRFGPNAAQLFVSARQWTKQLLDGTLANIPDVLLVFEDGLEAAIYVGIQFEYNTLTEEAYERGDEVLSVLPQRGAQRTVVVCQLLSEALRLGAQLEQQQMPHLIYSERTERQESALKQWQPPSVLITTDEALPMLKCGQIDCLLHYTLTANWHNFKARFELLYDTYINGAHNNETALINVRLCKPKELWVLCNFMMQHEIGIPAVWLQSICQSHNERELDEQRRNAQLCRQFCTYGNCWRRTCRYRHVLWTYECQPPADHPSAGTIEFQILNTYSPAQLAVRLTKHEANDHGPITALCMQIQEHYSEPDKRIQHKCPQVADVCVVKYKGKYERVGVTRIISDKLVEIKMLDSRTDFLNIDVNLLYECDKLFYDTTFQANELRIIGLTPYSLDRQWSDDAKMLVRNKFFNRKNGPRVYTATVEFAFYDFVFVKNVHDDQGQDLLSFVHQHLVFQMDGNVRQRLKCAMNAARQFVPSTGHGEGNENENEAIAAVCAAAN